MSYNKKRREVVAKGGAKSNTMTLETKNFIQKICYKKSASIDMTTYGFMKDSKLRQISLMIKPLRNQLERIWGPGKSPNKNTMEKLARRKEKKMPPVKPPKTNPRDLRLEKCKSIDHNSDLTRTTAIKKQINKFPRYGRVVNNNNNVNIRQLSK